MKKWIAMLVALLVLCVPALAEENWYLTAAQELTVTMGELARDEGYQQAMTGQSYDCIQAIQSANFAKIKSVYRARIPVRGLLGILKLMGQEDLGDMSQAGIDRLTIATPQTLMTMYNGNVSMECLPASSILTVSKTYIMPEDFEDCMMVLELDGAVAGAAFMATGEDTVTVQVQPMFCEEGKTVEDVIAAIPGSSVIGFEQIR